MIIMKKREMMMIMKIRNDTATKERISIELMTSDRKVKASREGSERRIYWT